MQVNKESELSTLLQKNADWEGLNKKEYDRAYALILNGKVSDEDCWLCKVYNIMRHPEYTKKALHDFPLCKRHALYALATRK